MEEIDKISTEISEGITDIEIDYYSRKLAVGTPTGKIYVYDNFSNILTKPPELSAHIGPVYKLSWSNPSFGVLASGGFDKKVNIIIYNNQLNGNIIYNHELHENCVTCLKFSPSNKNLLLISGDLNGNIISSEYSKDKNDFITNKIFGHDFGVNSIDFLTDDKFITCGNDNRLKIWNYTEENGINIIKCEQELKNENNLTIKDLSCKDDKHFVCCGSNEGESLILYWILNEKNIWEAHEIYRNEGNLEKIRFNEEHTCIVVVDDKGKEILLKEDELSL